MNSIPPTHHAVSPCGRTLIRPFAPTDLDEFLAATDETAESLRHWMAWYHGNYSRDDAERFLRERETAWQSGDHFSFAICDGAAGRLVGGVGLNAIQKVHRHANLGYWIRASAAGQGHATRATRLCARFGFEQLGLARIEITAEPENVPSLRVAEKAGAIREGIARHKVQVRGGPRDVVVFSLLPSDLRLGHLSQQAGA